MQKKSKGAINNMLKNYLIVSPVDAEEVNKLLSAAFSGRPVAAAERIERGSTNLVYRASVDSKPYIVKIAFRPEHIKQGVLFKEADMLAKFADLPFPFAIPKVVWKGRTASGLPALIETALPGVRAEDIITSALDAADAARTLGRFMAILHGVQETRVDEFENGRESFPSFADYARHRLSEWRTLCYAATHIETADVAKAYEIIETVLPLFSETSWPYVHADISFENLHAEIKDNRLVFTGLCDFENVQTAPPEYDISTIDDGLFLFYPQMEQPFLEGYESVHALPAHFERRLTAASLFRALRYIKRSVKYNEIHYFDHDRNFLIRWLGRAVGKTL